jgi:molecular chaperone DnaK (HSP70)
VKQNEDHEKAAIFAVRTAQSIGIEVHGGRAIVLIPAGSRTPVARAMTFTTVADGQRAVEVRVVRCSTGGAARHPEDSARPSGVVGRFLVPGLRTGRRGQARIDIGISLDREGVIRAWGVDRSTGARQEATFAGLWALPPGARPRALSALAQRVDAELARPEFEGIAARNVMREPAEQEADGPGLAALAGEIDSIRRSTAEPPVRL